MSHHPHAARLRATIVGLLAVAAAVLAACASSHHAARSGAAATRTVAAAGATGTTRPMRTAGPMSSSAGATVTTTRRFAPFDRSGAATAGVVARRSGSCFTTSITVSASDAYRCLAGNSILDPCFVTPALARVLDCYAAPWSRAVRLRVTRALPAAGTPLPISRPWAIELDGGVRCVATNGTPRVVRGTGLSYECAGGAAGLLTERNGSGLQRALYVADDGAVRTLAVATEWRA